MDRLSFAILSSKSSPIVVGGDIDFSEQDSSIIRGFGATIQFSEQDATLIRIIGEPGIDFSEQDATLIR